MNVTKRITGAAVVAAALAIGWASGAAAAETIKIGVIQPLTGAFAASGNDVTNGAKIAVDHINATGGVLGKELELVVEDSKANPTEAVAAAEKLITRDEVPVLMGASGSSATLAVMPKLREYKVPMVVETSSAGKITTSGNPYIFRISPPSSVEAEAFSEEVDELGIEKVDFLVVNNDWGTGAADAFSEMLKEKGVEVGLIETMDAAAQDVTSQLSKIKASGADTLMLTGAVEQLTLALRQAHSLGFDRTIITTGGSQDPDQLVEQAGAAAEGTMHLTFFAPWTPESTPNPELAKKFIEEWTAGGHRFAGLTSSFRGYDGILTIAAAIERAGKAEPEAIRKALWEVSVDGLNGKIEFEPVGPSGKESGQSMPNVYLVKVSDGKIESMN